MEDRKEIQELLKMNEEKRREIMEKLQLKMDDLENLKLWGKWLKYFFRHEIFDDYKVTKKSLDEWLNDDDVYEYEGRTEDDNPFGIEQAYLLKSYYDYVLEYRKFEYSVKNSTEEDTNNKLQTEFKQREFYLSARHNSARMVAIDSIRYIKWLISKSDEETQKKAFEQYRTIQSYLLWIDILKYKVVFVKTVKDYPVEVVLYKSSKKYVQDFGEYCLGKSKAEMTGENRSDCWNKKLDFYSRIFKSMNRDEIESAFRFLFDGKEDEEALHNAYRFLYEYALCMIFVSWMNLRSTLKIADYAKDYIS